MDLFIYFFKRYTRNDIEHFTAGQRLPTSHQFTAPGPNQAQKLSSSKHIRTMLTNTSQVKLMTATFMMEKPNQL